MPDKNIKSNSDEIKASESENINNQTKEININQVKNELPDKNIKSNSDEIKDPKSEGENNEKNKNNNRENDTKSNDNIKSTGNLKIDKDQPSKTIPKPKKELPIEKKPFQEFIKLHFIPAFTQEINQRGFEINEINLENTNRPIAGDKCWVINCEIKNTCNFWLSFEKEDISSLKSISLAKPNQKPSIIESFLIDEKKITLKLIISRVLQRLNGQKLIGVN